MNVVVNLLWMSTYCWWCWNYCNM